MHIPRPKFRRPTSFTVLTTVFLFVLFSLSLFFVARRATSPLVTPLATKLKILGLQAIDPPKPTKVVYGFLPYWNFKHYPDIPFHQLTHLAIFGVAFQPDGSFQTRELDYQEPGWRALNIETFDTIASLAKLSDTKLILTLRAFDNDLIESIISEPEHVDTLIKETLSFVDEKQYDGINIDFEYDGRATPLVRQQFTDFVEKLSQATKAHNPDLLVDIDVYAISAEGGRLWDLAAIAPHIDHIIIMAYDFYRPASSTAGPVSPLYGATESWPHDITSLLAKHLQAVPASKTLLGVPFYGYQWPTQTDEFLSPSRRSGSLATHSRVRSLLEDPPDNLTLNWDPISLTPWLSFTQDDLYQQIFYEDERSLGLKLDLTHSSELAGIAIWALGYEGPNSPYWQVIADKYQP